MISDTDAIARAVSGKTARPCDCCIRKRARWYCPSDDAFLCQLCDSSVHSANPLARRHHRVRLKTASLNPGYLPTWHRGLTCKPRTPRHAKNSNPGLTRIPSLRVPDLGGEDTTSSISHDGEPEIEEDRALFYRVPTLGLDPFAPDNEKGSNLDLDDLEEFAANVESLLGKGFDDESCGMDELGFLECGNMVKDESDDVAVREPFDLSFVYDDGDGDVIPKMCEVYDEDQKVKKKKTMSLRLDYEAIREEWAGQGCSPWMNGQRPQINLDDCWPQCFLGTIGEEMRQQLNGEQKIGGIGDGDREARVSRYREKRRTRLFSKKIRYEVRKLNAEKRPRMKGRFVKRPS